MLACIRRFEGVTLRRERLLVGPDEIEAARAAVPRTLRSAMRVAHARIERFSRASLNRSWTRTDRAAGTLGERFVPYDRVGAYIPGGAAPLVSTALMTVTLAKVAGVPEIVACTPAGNRPRS